MDTPPGSWSYYLERDGRKIELAEGEVILGRSRSATVQVEDPSVSRSHALLSLVGGRVAVKDLGSSNGTQVNGETVDGEQELTDGDRLTLGESEFVFRLAPCPPPGGAAATMRLLARGEDAAGAPWAPALPSPNAGPAVEALPDETSGELLPSLAELELPPLPPREESGARIFLPPAGFWVRLAAYLVDALWIAAAALLVSFASGGPRAPLGSLMGLLATLVLGVGVTLVGWTRWGTTPGKRLLGLRVCPAEGGVGIGFGKAALRCLGYALSGAVFGLGFVMIAFNASKRGLHDLIAGTYVGRQ